MEEYGFIKLHRQLLKNPIASNLEVLWLFSALLLRASFVEKEFYLWYKKIKIKPWQFVSSIRKLAEEFDVTRSKIHRTLDVLKAEHILGHEWNTKYSLFTIINWDKYQLSGTQSGTQSRHKVGHEWYTIKKDKKEKERIEYIINNISGADREDGKNISFPEQNTQLVAPPPVPPAPPREIKK